jgi:hypothetical protein
MNFLVKQLPVYAADTLVLAFALLYKILTLNFSVRTSTNATYSKPIAILGNGPSLLDDISTVINRRFELDIYVVNYFANSDYFTHVQPSAYILADPIFWSSDAGEKYKKDNHKLMDNLLKVDWKMTLVCREEGYMTMKKLLLPNTNINVVKLPSYWFDLRSEKANIFALRSGLSSPNYVNVLIAAIWYALLVDSKSIELYGADFSGFKELRVDQETNLVYSSNSHFYEESFDLASVKEKYIGVGPKMINIRFYQIWLGFRQMYFLAKVAETWGVKIKNHSSFSFLDCFDRK